MSCPLINFHKSKVQISKGIRNADKREIGQNTFAKFNWHVVWLAPMERKKKNKRRF